MASFLRLTDDARGHAVLFQKSVVQSLVQPSSLPVLRCTNGRLDVQCQNSAGLQYTCRKAQFGVLLGSLPMTLIQVITQAAGHGVCTES